VIDSGKGPTRREDALLLDRPRVVYHRSCFRIRRIHTQGGTHEVCWQYNVVLEGVPREQKMLEGHLPSVIYHQVYYYTEMKCIGCVGRQKYVAGGKSLTPGLDRVTGKPPWLFAARLVSSAPPISAPTQGSTLRAGSALHTEVWLGNRLRGVIASGHEAPPRGPHNLSSHVVEH
jgi:hypothetical protein